MLTRKQHQLLEFIDKRLAETGISPSFDEMKDALGLKSKSGVHRLVSALEERGFLRRLKNRARALEVVKRPEFSKDSEAGEHPGTRQSDRVATTNFTSQSAPTQPLSVHHENDNATIPMHGRIAAGTPIEAIEHPDGQIHVPGHMLGRSANCYALEVSGDSMIDLGIMDGDTVIIESRQDARDGDVVVALVDREEATLKTLKRQNNFVALVPANREHETQIYEPERVQIQGRLVGLLRQYH